MVNHSNKTSLVTLIPTVFLASYVSSNTFCGLGIEAFNNAPEFWGLAGAVSATILSKNLEKYNNYKAKIPYETGVLRRTIEVGLLGGITSYIPAEALSSTAKYLSGVL